MISNVEGAHKIAEPSGEPLHPTMAPTTTKASTTERLLLIWLVKLVAVWGQLQP
jgi:hypothetical protein